MSRAKAKRQPKAHTDVATSAERDEAVRTLLKGGQFESVTRMHFCDSDRGLPIAGLPRPKPCPFCGSHTDAVIVFETNRDTGEDSAHVECTHCGTEAAYVGSSAADYKRSYQLAWEAAQLWNTRGGQ